MKRLIPVILAFISMLYSGCNKGVFSPVSPSSTNSSSIYNVSSQWSPYIVVQTPGGVDDSYRDALTALVRSGNLRGLRVGIDSNPRGLDNPLIRIFGSMGVEVLGLIDNYYLFDSNIEQDIDRIFAAYPEIHYFQIGNEITTILPKSGPTMTIDQYMSVLKRVYDYVQTRYPGRATLLTQSTFGSGTYGANELNKMVDLGLNSMSPENLIIAINVYSDTSLEAYPGVINGRLNGYRIWVTETGIADPDLHISYVQKRYPEIRNYMRPERIYWYVLWGGDDGSDVGYGLIKNPGLYPNYWKSPLFKALTSQ